MTPLRKRRFAAMAIATLCVPLSLVTGGLAQTLDPGPQASASADPSPNAPPPLFIAKTRLQLNPGATTEIGLSGGVPPYAFALSSPVAEVRIDRERSTLSLRAFARGTATLTVSDTAGATVRASLLIAPDAGFVPSQIGVTLFGAPSPEYIAAQILAALRRAAHPLPGARVVVEQRQYPTDMRPGERLDLPVRVHLDGHDRYVDVDAVAELHVVTRAAPPLEPVTLFYSDDPEKVDADGVLLRGTFAAGRSIRLYYYHQALAPAREIRVLLDSPGGTARVRVAGQGAGPNAAVMYVGQSATFRYLDGRARGAGVALDVPVGAPVELFAGDRPMQAGDLEAGILDVAIAEGDPVRVTVLAVSQDPDLRSLLLSAELPTDGKHRRGEFELENVAPLRLSYRVGEPEPAPVAVGGLEGALTNLRPGGRALAGDYGLLRPLEFTLTNPTLSTASVYLYEQPVGFPVTTTIFFDGEPAPSRIQCVKNAGRRYLVRAFGIAPGATERITGNYMTDGGSTYPLTLGLTGLAPLEPPATMTAADGCFPNPAGPAPIASPALSP